ncbi:MAG: hypothetical protein RIG84_11645 [Roseovarius sp.]
MRLFTTALATLAFSAFTLGALSLSAPRAAAQMQESIFRDYDEMREVLDRLIMAREIEEVMRAFGGSDEMTAEQLAGLEARVRGIFPYDFRHVARLKQEDMGAGFRRELYVYWAGTAYLFATVFFHEREGETVAINFRFNTDFNALNEGF